MGELTVPKSETEGKQVDFSATNPSLAELRKVILTDPQPATEGITVPMSEKAELNIEVPGLSAEKPKSVGELLKLAAETGTQTLEQRREAKAVGRAELKAGMNIMKDDLKSAGRAAMEGAKVVGRGIKSGIDALRKVSAGLRDENVRAAVGEYVGSKVTESREFAKDKVAKAREASKDQGRLIVDATQESMRDLGKTATDVFRTSVDKGKEIGKKAGHGVAEYFKERAVNTVLRMVAGADRLSARTHEVSERADTLRSERIGNKADRLFQKAEKARAASGELRDAALGRREKAADLRGGAEAMRAARKTGRSEAAPTLAAQLAA